MNLFFVLIGGGLLFTIMTPLGMYLVPCGAGLIYYGLTSKTAQVHLSSSSYNPQITGPKDDYY